MHELVSRTCYTRHINRSACVNDLIHTVLILVEWGTYPETVVMVINNVLIWKGHQRGYSLQTFKFFRELIFDKEATFGSAEICAALLIESVVEGFMNYSNAGSHIETHSNHTRDMVQVALSKTLCPVKRVDPDNHFLLVKFIRKFEEVPIWFCSNLPEYLLLLSQIISIRSLLTSVVLKEHFLRDMLGVYLLRQNVRLLAWVAFIIIIFLANNFGTRVELLQIKFDGLLNPDVGRREYVTCCSTYVTS